MFVRAGLTSEFAVAADFGRRCGGGSSNHSNMCSSRDANRMQISRIPIYVRLSAFLLDYSLRRGLFDTCQQ